LLASEQLDKAGHANSRQQHTTISAAFASRSCYSVCLV